MRNMINVAARYIGSIGQARSKEGTRRGEDNNDCLNEKLCRVYITHFPRYLLTIIAQHLTRLIVHVTARDHSCERKQ